MKTLLNRKALLILIPTLFFSLKSVYSQGTSYTAPFRISALDNAYGDIVDPNNQIKFNFWHKYAVPRTLSGGEPLGKGWNGFGTPSSPITQDFFETPVSVYKQSIINKILDNSNVNHLYTQLDRPKIEYLAFGQSSEYQCENISVSADYGFYAYNNSKIQPPKYTDITEYENIGIGNNPQSSIIKVKQCIASSTPGSNPEIIISGLRANREQMRTSWPYDYIGDQLYNWYIMPKIRIDRDFANNINNQDIPVCKIIIKSANGQIKEQILYVEILT